MNPQTATFGAGCFWCTEAIFQQLKGVNRVVSGYTGGKTENPTYEEVCAGDTGHAEVIRIEFDASEISFDELLLIFFKTHDPTTPNRQGNDQGPQYRSAIFYQNEEQKKQAERMVAQLSSAQVFEKPVVTEITPATSFYPAEGYHQNYFNANPDKPYCSFVIRPKLDKFYKEFKERLKSRP
jgi:peptide-methionine (S)-S-oxide reductase